jgi:hypothetical protein
MMQAAANTETPPEVHAARRYLDALRRRDTAGSEQRATPTPSTTLDDAPAPHEPSARKRSRGPSIAGAWVKRVCAITLGVIPGFAQVGFGIGATVFGIAAANPLAIGFGVAVTGFGLPYLAVSIHLANKTRDTLQDKRVKRFEARQAAREGEQGSEHEHETSRTQTHDLDSTAQQVGKNFEELVLNSSNADARALLKTHAGEHSPASIRDLPAFADLLVKEFENGNVRPEPSGPQPGLDRGAPTGSPGSGTGLA